MAGPYAGGAKMRIIGTIQGQDCINVLHFGKILENFDNPDAVVAALTQLAVAMLACAFDNLRAGVTSDWSLRAIEVSQIAPVKGPTITVPPTQATVGQLSPSSVSFTASLVNVVTGLGGRSHRGRIFLPPAGETETANSILNQGAIDAITQFLNCVAGKFIGQGGTEQWRLGVLSAKAIKAGQSFDASFTEAVALIPNNKVACMRSRKVGHGS